MLSRLSFFTIVCLQPDTTYVYNVAFCHYYVFYMYVSEENKRRQNDGGGKPDGLGEFRIVWKLHYTEKGM